MAPREAEGRAWARRVLAAISGDAYADAALNFLLGAVAMQASRLLVGPPPAMPSWLASLILGATVVLYGALLPGWGVAGTLLSLLGDPDAEGR